MHDVLDLRDIVPDEVAQLRLSGHAVPEPVAEAVRAAAASGDLAALRRLAGRLREVPRSEGWAYDEPQSADEVLAFLDAVEDPAEIGWHGTNGELSDRVTGAWLGRAAGCCLGKPVEGLTPEEVAGYLGAVGAAPLRAYLPWVEDPGPGVARLNGSAPVATAGHITAAPRDDDTDYTILGLHLVERYGAALGPAEVAQGWLELLPFLQTYTAERAAYRNLVRGIDPTRTAVVDNPYREWIGALIRADVYGYVNPGDPRAAAVLAVQDARLSHVANGIYGAAWAAALVAAAFTAADPAEALRRSLCWIPGRTRLHHAVSETLNRFSTGQSWTEFLAWLHAEYRSYSWVHTVNNAALIAGSLLWGAGDIARTLGMSVEGGLDTDSSTATVGSVLGAMYGAAALPGHLVDPLDDRIRSAVHGYDDVPISELSARTMRVVGRARP